MKNVVFKRDNSLLTANKSLVTWFTMYLCATGMCAKLYLPSLFYFSVHSVLFHRNLGEMNMAGITKMHIQRSMVD